MNLLKIDYSSRIVGLDILRAFAIITVVYNHGWVYSQKFIPRATYDYFHFDGVTLFFVLSGFLIGGIIFKTIENKGASFNTLKDFWIRRWFRTLPLYYLVLLFLVIEISFSKNNNNGLISYFIFCQNFFVLKNGFFLESWSLAVEEWFYILFPLIIWSTLMFFKFNMKKIVPIVILFFIVGCIAIRMYKFNLYKVDIESGIGLASDRFPFTVICRLDSLMYGILCAYIFHYFKEYWIKYKNTLFYLGLTILVLDYVFYNYTIFLSDKLNIELARYRHVFHYSIMPFCIALIIPFFYFLKSSNRISRAAIYISIISYSLYLTHLPIVFTLKLPDLFSKYIPLPETYQNLMSYILYWGFSIIISTFLYKYYEKPMTDLREKLTKD